MPPKTAQQELIAAVSTLVESLNRTAGTSTVTNALLIPKDSKSGLLNEFAFRNEVYNSASSKLAIAEKNYIISNDDGADTYNTEFDERISYELGEIEHIIIDDYKNNMNFIDQIAKQYKSEISALNNAQTGYDKIRIENDVLTKKLDAYSKILNTNERKTVYELQNMKSLHLYRRVLFFIYYLLIAQYIFFGEFIPKKLYTDYTYLVILLIVIIFPFILNTIISWTIMCINALHFWLDDSIAKDVYAELDKTT